MKPEFLLSWTSAATLDNIKIKKTLKILLIKLTGTASWNLQEHRLSYKLSCKDTILNGRITYDPTDRSIDYRKQIPLPFLVANKLGRLVATARWAYHEDSQTWNRMPMLGAVFEFGHGSAELVRHNSVRFKPRFYVKNVGLEAKALVSLHLPSKLLFDLAHGPGSSGNLAGAASAEEDVMGLNLDIQQLDLVIRL